MEQEHVGESRARAGHLDRRQLIKRAAAAGAVAWTAPIVIDSLASPAGALTQVGCFRFTINASNSGCANASIVNTSLLACLPVPSAACPSGFTTVTSGTINSFCLTVTQGDEGNNDDCQPEFLQVDDTVIFGINTGLGACDCGSPTIEAAAGLFSNGISATCHGSLGGQVTINPAKTSVTFGNPGIGLWLQYSFVIKCS